MKSDKFTGLEDNEFASFDNFWNEKPTVYTGTVKVEKKSSTIDLDPRKIAAALTHRDYVNQLMGF